MNIRTQQGFTLIELMIVVAIIGILAAIAVPQYSTYLTRSKLVEGFVLSGSAVKAVVDYYGFHGRLPADNTAAGLASPERLGAGYVQSITVNNGAIRIQYRREVMGSEWAGEEAVLTLRPATAAGSGPSPHLHWICGLAEPVEGTVLLAAGETTIPAHILPANCQ